ncbi:hypothetical protein [Acetobacter syzygii]|uniref:hypothetical protein n=1 Tax=Acetobacter syzygii TaxID=146476 RepID=UPI00156E2672|nr:hypothetical protein [Acetobacter syzygii]NSL92928.1 hypothetical protein [Acetobacter syzygii]
MARKNMGKLILEMGRDMRMQALGHAAFGIWVMLMGLIEEIGLDGSVTFGMGRAPSLADVARIRFGISETELKTHLETQSKTEVLSWNDETQTLAYGPELQPSRRTLANRENGKKGGRPPGKRITERTDPAQRHMPPMLIKGGNAVQNNKPKPETHSPIAKLANTESIKARAKLCEPSKDEIDVVYRRIGPKAFDAAGFDPARDTQNWSAARQWAADGLAYGLTADEIERLVVAEVSTIAKRQKALGRPVSHLGYFKKAITEAIMVGDIPAIPVTAEQRKAEQAFEAAMLDWMRAGAKGPQPRLEDFCPRVAA